MKNLIIFCFDSKETWLCSDSGYGASLDRCRAPAPFRLGPDVASVCHRTVGRIIAPFRSTKRPQRTFALKLVLKFFFTYFIPPTCALKFDINKFNINSRRPFTYCNSKLNPLNVSRKIFQIKVMNFNGIIMSF